MTFSLKSTTYFDYNQYNYSECLVNYNYHQSPVATLMDWNDTHVTSSNIFSCVYYCEYNAAITTIYDSPFYTTS